MTRNRSIKFFNLLIGAVVLFAATDSKAQDKSVEEILRERAAQRKASLFKHPPKDDPEVNRVVKALKDRAARIHTAHLEWTLTRVDKAGSFSGARVASATRVGALPRVDTTTELRNEVWFAGGQLRVQEDGQFWHVDFDHPIDMHKSYAYLADKATHFNQSADLNPDGAGIVAVMDEVSPLCNSESAPISVVLSPLDPRITPWMSEGPLERFPAKDDAESICIHVQPFGTYFWASKSNPQRIVRLESLRKDATCAQETTVEWEEVAGIGAVPRRWAMTQFDREGAITHVVTGEVTRREFNAPIPNESLTLTFAQGVQVHDDIRNATFIADGAGGLLPFDPRAPQTGRLGSLSVLGAAALGLGAVLIIVLRRRQRATRFLT